MADYWLAPALEVLRAEINARYPDRDKRSDGWIGDKYHAGSKSDHNPSQWPPLWKGVVRAFDCDNDLRANVKAQVLADHLAPMLGVHPALGSGAYLIYNGRIISTDRKREGWRKYSGKNPHTGHIHISVGTSPAAYNSRQSWGISATSPAPAPLPEPEQEDEDDMKHIGIHVKRASGSDDYAIINTNSGFVKIIKQGTAGPVDVERLTKWKIAFNIPDWITFLSEATFDDFVAQTEAVRGA